MPTPDAHRRQLLAACAGLALMPAPTIAAPGPMTIPFRGTDFLHRWSQQGQHEFTPRDDADLKTWRDMITLNVHDGVRDGEQLAATANQVLANYQRHGRILQTRSVPRTPQRPAEHLIVAVLGTPQLLEAAFARCLLHDGVGLIAVVSHRIHGQAVGPAMSDWLRANGPQVEQAWMGWNALPPVAGLRQLPRQA